MLGAATQYQFMFPLHVQRVADASHQCLLRALLRKSKGVGALAWAFACRRFTGIFAFAAAMVLA